ncbi:unnamed protein product [Ostreobium quekettii]|uniref:Thiol-disulfide oxidoreductase DCC n=1 Tax=Ostreobium quekettii TaxID=121088 RepID=A0A8S1JCK5_9CHLO|nr:unnamed protein product [Ostreobium quekettii]
MFWYNLCRDVVDSSFAVTKVLSACQLRRHDCVARFSVLRDQQIEMHHGLRQRRGASAVSRLTASAAAGAVEPAPQTKQMEAADAAPTWQIRLLYDSECPLCMKEVAMLMSRDDGKGKIDFVDICSPSYDAAENGGVTFETAMRRIHGVLPDGSVVSNVEVFRRCYEAVGLGWLYEFTKYYPFGPMANAVYELWAANRLRVTGRPDLATILEERRGTPQGANCDEDSCEIEFPPKRK